MPAAAPSGAPNKKLTAEPRRRAPLTPSASPSVGPPDRPPTKRPRLRSTPSSSISATPSTSNESTSSVDVNSARRASTLRVLNVWTQLAERYNKHLDKDDIVDLYSGAIIKDRGVLRGASRDYHFGHFAQSDSDQDQDESEQDDDDNDLNALPPSEPATDDDAPISKTELLRGMPPLSATTDAEDLREFLEAEKKRKERAGDEEDEEDMSPERLSALRKALEEQSQNTDVPVENQAHELASTECARNGLVDTTPTRPSTGVPQSDDESEDELSLWRHDESTAVYPVPRDKSKQALREAEQEVIELTDSDSDAEFEAILVHPPSFSRTPPPPVTRPKEVQQTLQSPPDSDRGKSTSRSRSHSKIKSAEILRKSESRPRVSRESRKLEVVISHRSKRPVSNDTGIITSNDGTTDKEAVGRIPPTHKGKGKEVSPLVEDTDKEKTPKSLVTSRGRKRKRIASSPTSCLLAEYPVESKSNSRSHVKSTPQNTTHAQLDSYPPTFDKDVSTPARFQSTVAGSSRSSPTFSSASKTYQPTFSIPDYRSPEPGSAQRTSQDHDSNSALLSEAPISITCPCPLRHHSHPPPTFAPPGQGFSGLTPHAHPPPMDPVQTQQAHYLLAQAMHQLSYLISATVPSYAPYGPNPGQPWHHPSLPPPHAEYGTPVQHPPHFHNSRPYHTPSSSISRSELPPSSPVQPPVSPVGEGRARSRGRSKSRGRRVSFRLDSDEVFGSREHDNQSEPRLGGQKNRGRSLEVKHEKGIRKGESEEPSRLEDGDGPAHEVARGRTPGPPNRKKIDVSRGRSLGRRQ